MRLGASVRQVAPTGSQGGSTAARRACARRAAADPAIVGWQRRWWRKVSTLGSGPISRDFGPTLARRSICMSAMALCRPRKRCARS